MKTFRSTALVFAMAFAGTAGASTYDGYTPPGTHLSVGQPAVLPSHIPYKGAFPLGIRVTGIERGSLEELRQAGYTIPEKLAGSVPYYVDYSIRVIDANGYPSQDLAGTGVTSATAIDDRGERHMATLFNGALAGLHFDRCGNPATLKLHPHAGSTAHGCEMYMVDSRGAITGWQVQVSADAFNGNRAYWDHPVVWTASENSNGPEPSQDEAEPSSSNNW